MRLGTTTCIFVALLTVLFCKANGSFKLETIICWLSPWRVSCENIVQAQFMAIGKYTGGDVHNAFECLSVRDASACDQTITEKGFKCGWCDTDKQYIKTFGEGTCLFKNLQSMTCPYLGRVLFQPSLDSGIPYPPAYILGECLKHSDSEENCLNSGNCLYCDVPDAYGWEPQSKACLPEAVMNDRLEPNHNWCKLLNSVPENAHKTKFHWPPVEHSADFSVKHSDSDSDSPLKVNFLENMPVPAL